MDRGSEKKTEWLKPELLMQFIDELRVAGYRIGTDQYIAVHDLLLTLLRQGSIEDIRQLKSLVGPIVCSSPEEQENFQQRFDIWADLAEKQQYNLSITVEQRAEELSAELEKLDRRANRGRRTLRVLVLSTVVFFSSTIPVGPPDEVIIIEALEQPNQTAPVPTSENEEPTELEPIPDGFQQVEEIPNESFNLVWPAYLLFSVLVLFNWRLWWQWRARLFLDRLGGTKPSELNKISMKEFDLGLFTSNPLSDVARQLRERTRRLTETLDVKETIQTSLNNGGWLTPIYSYRKSVPEYLVLIDRAGYRDHQAKFVEKIVEELKQDDVYISTYFFDEDVQVCYSIDLPNMPKTLQAILNRYRHDRLVVVAAAERFYNSRTNQLSPWVQQLHSWETRAVLVPKTLSDFGRLEAILAQQWVVLPLTSLGIDTLAKFFQTGNDTYSQQDIDTELLPAELNIRPQQWLARNSPPVEAVQKMLDSLQAYLGVDGFYWLAACAIFPELRWDITLYLGTTLETEQGQSILESTPSIRLFHLPWFRFGYMPDWLRENLLSRLTRKKKSYARGKLQELLVTGVQGETSRFQIEIAKQHRRFLPQLSNSLLYLIAKEAEEESPMKDYIFLSFMVKKPKLAIEATDNLQQLVDKSENQFGFGLIRNAILALSSFSTYNIVELLAVFAVAGGVWGASVGLSALTPKEFQPRPIQTNEALLSENVSAAKQRGLEALSRENYAQAVEYFSEALAENKNDPESLIYLNNARIGNRSGHTVALVVPSGSSQSVAAELMRGVAQAQSEKNERRKTPLKVLLVNDSDDIDTARGYATSFADNESVLGVIGHYSSGTTLAASEIYEASGLPMITPTSTSVDIASAGGYIFRTVPSDRLMAATLSRYVLNDLNANQAVVFSSGESAYSDSVRSEFTTELISNGGRVVASYDVSQQDFDANQALERARRNGADVIMLALNTSTLEIANQIIRANQRELPMVGGDSLYSPVVLSEIGDSALGLTVAIPWQILAHTESSYVNESRQLWGGDVNWRSAMAYDAFSAIDAAADDNPTRSEIAANLGGSGFTAEGATDPIRFLPTGDRNQSSELVTVVEGNRSGTGYDYEPVTIDTPE